MRGYIANTDHDWYEFLRRRPLSEVNFWQPSGGRAFRAIQAGAPFFFRLKSPHNAIGGFGCFALHRILPAWLAWESFEVANGAPDLRTMRRRIERYRKEAAPSPTRDYQIGCLMITDPIFFPPDEWVAQPSDWQRAIQQGTSLSLRDGEGRRIWEDCMLRARERPERATESPMLVSAERYGRPQLVRPRLGQGTFKIAVTEAYERACAVSEEHSLPALDAAHIRPFADGGEHTVSNGILLRVDIHRLFDRGYVTVTPGLRFEISSRLKEDWANGRSYEGLKGKLLHVPRSREERPNPKLLAWHNESRYLG